MGLISTLQRTFAYYRAVRRFPHRADFLDAGLGIEARSERCAQFWAPHLSCSRQFISEAVKQHCAGKKVSVLGAGRLLDLPIEVLAQKYKEIELFDADPLCVASWRAAQKKFTQCRFIEQLGDLTGVLDAWLQAVQVAATRSPVSVDRISHELEKLAAALQLTTQLGNTDLLLSLNILSQIGLYWRDRVDAELTRHGIVQNNDGLWDGVIEDAMQSSMAALERQHLKLLEESRAPVIVLISDELFMYYRTDQAPWRVEQALITGEPKLKGYTLESSESWFWHLAPAWIEKKEYGEIHQVRAQRWVRVYDL